MYKGEPINIETLLELKKQYEKTIKDLFKKISKLEKTIEDKDKIIKEIDKERFK